jgi:pimeloyl-ACP methyl ester carboxylesterase
LAAAAASSAVRVVRRYRKDMEQIRSSLKDLPAKMFLSKSTGLSVQYMEREPQRTTTTKPAVTMMWCLVLHPSGGGCDQGLVLGELLLPKDCGIIAPSRAGYLESSQWKPPPPQQEDEENQPVGKALDAQAKAIVELLDHLDLQQVSIVGLSAGSILALELTRLYPSRVSSLVLLSPIIPYKQEGKDETLFNPPQWVLKLAFGNDFVKWMAVRLFTQATLQSIFGSSSSEVDQCQKALQTAIVEALLPARERFPGFLLDLEAIMTHRLTAEQLFLTKEIQCKILFLASQTDVQSKLEYNRLPNSTACSETMRKQEDQDQMIVTEIIRESGTHMLLDDIPGTQVAIEQFFAKNHASSFQ